MDELDKAKLSVEQLEAITGGVIGGSEEDVLKTLIKAFKEDGWSIDGAIRNTAYLAGVKNTALANCTSGEVEEFIKTHWDEF